MVTTYPVQGDELVSDKFIIRGDSYDFEPRYLYRHELVDLSLPPNPGDGSLQPYDLSGCVVRTTYKAEATSPIDDPTDESAPIKHDLVIGLDGTVTSSNGLRLESTAAAGVIIEDLPSSESLALPVGVPLYSDVEITDAAGKVQTVLSIGTLTARDGYTNRST